MSPKELAGQYKHGCMPPNEVAHLYDIRNAAIDLLVVKKDSITVDDIITLDRLGRFRVANELFGKCDLQAQSALLDDAHAHVRSAAQLFDSSQFVAKF